MAQVYQARLAGEEEREDNFVALKITRTGDERPGIQDLHFDALSNEVENLLKLKHPNINRLLPVQTDARTTPYIARANNVVGRPWYCVMEFLAGGSLATLLDKSSGGAIPLNLAVETVYQVGLALAHIHSKGIAHLDVKPDNILFRKPLSDMNKPEAVLIDFGIARKENQSGLPAGAASYMAPERIVFVRGDWDKAEFKKWFPNGKSIDKRPADVYSLAVVLYRAVTGKMPFSRRDKSTTTDVILGEKTVPITKYLPDSPPILTDIIDRSLDKDPTKRATISEFLSALDSAVPVPRWKPIFGPGNHPPGPAPAIPQPKPSTAGLKKLMGVIALGVMATLLMISVIALLAFGSLTPGFNPNATAIPVAAVSTPKSSATTAVTVINATVTPLPTFTPIASATPYNPAIPSLSSPTNGQIFEGNGAKITLVWSGLSDLPENVYYVVSLYRTIGGVRTGSNEYAITRETRIPLPATESSNLPNSGDIKYEWSVTIKRTSKTNVDGTKEWDPNFKVPSQTLNFIWRIPAPAPTLTPTPLPLPTRIPTQERR
jgi:hypothetical protein